MIPKILLALVLLTGLLQGQMLNAIAAVVNGKPITLHEIEQAATNEQMTTSETLEALIDLRLQEARIEELGLRVNDSELQGRIDLIAKHNDLDTPTLRQILRNRGVSWSDYQEQIRQSILNEKLAARVLADEMIEVSDEEIDRYYRQNPDTFTRPASIDVIQYVSAREDLLEEVHQNPMSQPPGVSIQPQILRPAELNPRLSSVLTQTPRGSFTPIFAAGDNYVTLLVRRHEELEQLPLQAVRSEIIQNLQEIRQERAISNYFARERTRAEIVILRQP